MHLLKVERVYDAWELFPLAPTEGTGCLDKIAHVACVTKVCNCKLSDHSLFKIVTRK